MSTDAGWEQHAEEWARGVVAALNTEYPSMAGHLATGPDDCDVSPRRLHPAFWGCLDWHSSAHMQWSALTMLDAAAAGRASLGREAEAALEGVLAERLTPANLGVEAEYLRAHPGFERPYGWGWVTLLAAAAARSSHAPAPAWAAALRPVADVVFDHTLGWLPRQAYPVRTGAHDNSAFGLALIRDAAGALGRPDVVAAVDARARDWYGADRDYPPRWEPSGTDFLSAALCEADLMRRVLGPGFPAWLAGFLPGLGASGDPLLTVPEVRDRSDGKLVHLFGLALSRAAQLRALAPHLTPDRDARVRAAIPALVAHAEPELTRGDFMSTHWLVSFALLAAGAAEPLSGAAPDA